MLAVLAHTEIPVDGSLGEMIPSLMPMFSTGSDFSSPFLHLTTLSGLTLPAMLCSGPTSNNLIGSKISCGLDCISLMDGVWIQLGINQAYTALSSSL